LLRALQELRLACLILIYSALVTLHTKYVLPQSEFSDARSSLAQRTMDQLSKGFSLVSEKMLTGEGLPLEVISPLTFHWGYSSLVYLTENSGKDPQSWTSQAAESIQSALKYANVRWISAGMYKTSLSLPSLQEAQAHKLMQEHI